MNHFILLNLNNKGVFVEANVSTQKKS